MNGRRFRATTTSEPAAGAGIVGLVGRDLHTPAFAQLAEGLRHGMGEDGRIVLLASSGGDAGRLGEVLESFWSLPAEGVVVLAGADRPDVSRFARRGLPVVVVGDCVPTPNVARVGFDVDMVARVSVNHLAASGLRRIGMIGPPIRSPGAGLSGSGFLAAVEAAGAEGAIVRAEATVSGGGAALRDLIEGFPGVDGVVAHNDLMAAGVIREAADLGVRVPTRIAVISADDMGLGALTIPALTSVRPVPERLIEAVTAALSRLIEEPGASPEPVAVPVEVVARESA